MRRRMLVLASVAVLLAFAGCRHKCWKHKDGCCDGPPPPIGSRGPNMLPPPGVPTQPLPPGAPSVLPPAGSGYLPPSTVPPANPIPRTGPDVLLPDPIPGGMSSRPTQPSGPSFLGGPVKPATPEPPKTATGLPGFVKVKEGVYAGGKPAIEGYDSLKNARFRTVIYLHGPGADVAAVKDLATSRDLNFIAIETTPETLATASATFNRAIGDRLNRSAYVFADDDQRTGALWYLYFRTVDADDIDAARLRAKRLGLGTESEEAKAYWLAISKVLEK